MRNLFRASLLTVLVAAASPSLAGNELRLEDSGEYGSGMQTYSVPRCGVFSLPPNVRIILPQWQLLEYGDRGRQGHFTDNGDRTMTYHYDPAYPMTATFPQFFDERGGHGGHGSWLITVRNEPCVPTLQPDTAATDHRRPVTVNVLRNDRAPSPSSPLRLTDVTQPSRGSLSWSEDGRVTFTPEPGQAGAFAVTYSASDGLGSSGTSTLTVTSRICYEQVWRDSETSCDMQGRNGSADFAGACTHQPERYEQVEVTCGS